MNFNLSEKDESLKKLLHVLRIVEQKVKKAINMFVVKAKGKGKAKPKTKSKTQE